MGRGVKVQPRRALIRPTFSDADQLMHSTVTLATWKDNAVSMSRAVVEGTTHNTNTWKHMKTANTPPDLRISRGRGQRYISQSPCRPCDSLRASLNCAQILQVTNSSPCVHQNKRPQEDREIIVDEVRDTHCRDDMLIKLYTDQTSEGLNKKKRAWG
ncbi:unnamed protein product [Pleuronectes platessa]|uniref:Uncharacterized protein n=1 Tax=Pleuronectes platessa TaxID=8262 RepID=A0A9N7VNA0_PLEPL|nr:unnamed protein product [Pleuronectes platessa]